MCVGAPLQIMRVDGLSAEAIALTADARTETISLALTGPLAAGDHVLAHLGSAMRVIDALEARHIADALDAVAAAATGQPFDHLIADLADRTPQLPEHLRPPHPAEDTP